MFIFAHRTMANTVFRKVTATTTLVPKHGEGQHMSSHGSVIVLTCLVALLTGTLVAAAAGYLARRDHASYPAAITRAAVAFAATLTFATALATALHTATGQ
ncbi:hypothetical protein [Streptomyces violaceorubidus]|uniref:hypothetical protein n=1 Tax=Streptomyces violaceorubidus TaxID=284042 RepID=UPI001FD749C6|nr:hypothetical protein [Streptomyces violaceorubidus]